MIKINKKMISIILIIVTVNLFYLINFKVNAETDLKNMQTQIDDFMEMGKKQVEEKGGATVATDIATPFVGLGQILTMVGAGTMVAVTAYMGIKYITASPEGQAKLKQQLIGLVVSGIVIFGAYGIWSIVLRIVSQF